MSDATALNGVVTNPIFEQIDYDLLNIGKKYMHFFDIIY